MNKKPNLSLRTSRPHTLASAFGGLMKMFGRTASDADLSVRWDEIMGVEISSIAKLAGITKCAAVSPRLRGECREATRGVKFNVAVRAANPAFALQLSYMTDEITARVNKYFGYDAVGRVVVRK